MRHSFLKHNTKIVEKRTLSPNNQSISIIDNRPTTAAQRKLIEGMHNVVQFIHPRLIEICQDVRSLEIDLRSQWMIIRNNIDSIQEYLILFRHYRQEINKIPEEPLNKNKIKAHIANIIRVLEKRFKEKSIEFYQKTYQESKTNKCWIISVFEGLRRSGLLFQIINPEDKDHWQKILEDKFFNINKIDDKTSRLKIENNLKISFDKFFKSVLPTYQHSLMTRNFFGTLQNKIDILPQNTELELGVHINEDASEIYFYTIDKPEHAMFYLQRIGTYGILVYNQATKKEETYYLNDQDPKKIPNMIQKHTFKCI